MKNSNWWTYFALSVTPLLANLCGIASAQETATNKAQAASLITLSDVASGKARILDLTHVLNEKNAYWPGPGYEPFRLTTIATIEKDGVLSKAFSMPEHLGTHIDAPNHFETGQPDLSMIKPDQLFGPGVVIDIAARAEVDADTTLTVEDIRDWEATHGQIPEGAIVLLHTGWGRLWNNYSRYKNQDAMGKLHFPSYSGEAAKFLIHQRKAKGLGIDNLSIDSGISKDFAVHHIVNKAGRYGLENVANLDKLPARGFFLIVAPIRIEAGSGGPTRILAVLPER
ncbi:MAG: cyclase family protein [Planctomycetota bacterium]|nr:cyclase family protein [Planctomycetota bacterium]MDA0918107.1 cyclase family protein [Planctomycetota bacterium]